MGSTGRIYTLLVALVIFWALNMPLAKIGLEYMPPFWLTAARLVIGAVSMLLFLGITQRLKLPKTKDWLFILSIGILQMGLFQILINCGMVYVDAGRATILVYSTPLWVTPLAVLFFGEKLTKLKLLGVILGITGIFVRFSPSSFSWSDPKILLGNGILLLASFCWAIAMMHSRYGKWHSSPLELVPWQLLVSTPLPLILAVTTEPFSHIHWNTSLVSIILYSGIIATAFGYWASITISKTLPVVTTSLAMLGVPILALIFSALIIAEVITSGDLLAMALIISGLICIILENKLSIRSTLPQEEET